MEAATNFHEFETVEFDFDTTKAFVVMPKTKANGKLLEEAYEDNQDLLTVIPRNCQGHHPHGLLSKSKELAEMVVSKLS